MSLFVLTFGNLFKKMEPRYILRLFLLIAPRDFVAGTFRRLQISFHNCYGETVTPRWRLFLLIATRN